MGFFSKILAKLGIGSDTDAVLTTPKEAASSPVIAPDAAQAPAAPKPMALVDVVVQLEQRVDLRGAVGVGGGDAGVSGPSCGERTSRFAVFFDPRCRLAFYP